MPAWFLYIIRCGDGSLYTGITTGVERRLQEHQEGGSKGAKYLRGRGPLSVVYTIELSDRSAATKLESRIKCLSKVEKEKVVSRQLEPTALLH